MDMINAVENIRRRAESVALAHPERPDEDLELGQLAELTFQESYKALLSGRENVLGEISSLATDLANFRGQSFFARLLRRSEEKCLQVALESAQQKRDLLTLEIESAKDKLFNEEPSKLQIRDTFESLRRNRNLRNDALAVCQAADALLVDMRKSIQRKPDFATKLSSRKLHVPARDVFDLDDAHAFISQVRREMQAAMDEP